MQAKGESAIWHSASRAEILSADRFFVAPAFFGRRSPAARVFYALANGRPLPAPEDGFQRLNEAVRRRELKIKIYHLAVFDSQ